MVRQAGGTAMVEFTIGLAAGWVIATILLGIYAKKMSRQHEEQILRVEKEKHVALNFIHNLAKSIAQEPSKEFLLARINHAVVSATGAASACIYTKTAEGKLKGLAIEGLFPPFQGIKGTQEEDPSTRAKLIEQILRSEEVEIGEGIIGEAAKSMKGLLIREAAKDPRIHQHTDPALLIRSLIVTPIQFDGELLGVLAVANQDSERLFDEEDLDLVETLAEQAAVAIQHLHNLIEHFEKQQLDMDLTLARDVQLMLMSDRDFESGQLHAHALYRPARKVSGDFYGILDLPGGKTGFAIGDVAGKGIPASLLMAICHTSLKHYARTHTSPAEVLKLLNAQVGESTRDNMFITLTYAIFDPADNTMTLARAGHELPLLATKQEDGKYHTKEIASGGMALGMVPPEMFDCALEDTTFPFPQGSVLHFYTDGATETLDPGGNEFSTDRLSALVTSSALLPPELTNQTILDTLQEFSKGAGYKPDDITLLTICHNPRQIPTDPK
jgi:sigma-B regulation protein RsbU (phosphoserine phosphatase)